ncbi:hypothetical protein EVAR_8444_1 [Eumeta japonica]|uniref:Uncharacterized protein n=1 Tax=Eumeta variegata TaxID=151549 RepID=A0A4C1WBS2_EUMVA|nr:hypothetical protein EVAR_8444_1 [Eumeta japonica]
MTVSPWMGGSHPSPAFQYSIRILGEHRATASGGSVRAMHYSAHVYCRRVFRGDKRISRAARPARWPASRASAKPRGHIENGLGPPPCALPLPRSDMPHPPAPPTPSAGRYIDSHAKPRTPAAVAL